MHGHIPLLGPRSTYNSFSSLDPFDRVLQPQLIDGPIIVSYFMFSHSSARFPNRNWWWPPQPTRWSRQDRSTDARIHTAVSLYRCRTDTGLRRFVAVTVIILYESYTSEIHGGTCFEHCRWVFSERWLHCMCIASAYSWFVLVCRCDHHHFDRSVLGGTSTSDYAVS
jgi:hypothetical protein